ncbi:hypothetical protein [Pseudomonas peli]|nr:hypothetical protein [Pseudomonas peli]
MSFDLAAGLDRAAAPACDSPQGPEVVVDGQPAAGVLQQRLPGPGQSPHK